MKRTFAALLLFAACTKSGGESPPVATRTLPPRLEAAARSFGEAVLAKNYVAAYDMMAAPYRQELPYPEFLKSITRYRDSAEGELKLDVRASDDDPQTLKDDGMVQMLVPEPLRGQILAEAILAFDPASGGEDAEEGWVLVMWLTEEAGQVRVLNYYQDD